MAYRISGKGGNVFAYQTSYVLVERLITDIFENYPRARALRAFAEFTITTDGDDENDDTMSMRT